MRALIWGLCGALLATGLGVSTAEAAPSEQPAPDLASPTPRPTPDPAALSCCRLAEATGGPLPAEGSSGGSAEGGEEANVAAWVVGLPGGGVEAPEGYIAADCTGWIFATDMPDIAGPNIAGGVRVDPDGTLAYLYQRDCGSDGTRQYVWVRQESPQTLARAAEQDLRIRLLPPPLPQLSPSTHSVVNLETWLAVVPQAPISVTADIPGLWTTVTARVAQTVFDLGDAVVVTCAGTGRIWDPHRGGLPTCAHTFRSVDPLGRNRVIRVRLIWEVTWTSSTGDSGTLDPVSSAERVLAYPVREIQTIGIRG